MIQLMEMSDPEAIDQAMGAGSGSYNPEMQRLSRVDTLKEGGETLSDLRDQEIIAFALITALDMALKTTIINDQDQEEEIGGLPMVSKLRDRLMALRVSRDRMGRQELMQALRPLTINYPGTSPFFEEEKKPGLIQRLMGLMHKRGSGGS